MLDTIEALLLLALPVSFALKTVAIGMMWLLLQFGTDPVGELGMEINESFRDVTIMSALLTWVMVLLAQNIDASEIDWPFVTLALTGLALWPIRVSYQQLRIYMVYRQILKRKRGMA